MHQTHAQRNLQFWAENEYRWDTYYSDAKQFSHPNIHIHIQDWKPSDYTYLAAMNIQGVVNSRHSLTKLTINDTPIACDSETHLVFSKKIYLNSDQNRIQIIAMDQKGNIKKQTLSIQRIIPEVMKIKHRLRLAIFPFETIPSKMDSTQFSKGLLDALHQQNRFNIIVREQIVSEKYFWSILSYQAQTETAEAIMQGRIIKSPKDIEIYIPLVTLDSRILGYADVYIPLQSTYDLKAVMTRLVKKLKHQFPLSNGTVNDYDTKHLCAIWQSSNHPIPFQWPAIVYREISNDPVRGSEQEIIRLTKIVRSQNEQFCVRTDNSIDITSHLKIILK